MKLKLRQWVKWPTVHELCLIAIYKTFLVAVIFPKTNGSWSSGGVLFEEDQQGVKDDYRADIKFHDDIMCWIWIPRIMVCYNLNNPCIRATILYLTLFTAFINH